MLRKPCRIATTFLHLSILCGLMPFLQPGACFADTSCNSRGGITTIGLEWVADQCIPYEMNDATGIHYRNSMIRCSDPAVTLEADYGDTLGSPASIIKFLRSQGYKVFRDREGSHIVAVHRFYSGEVGGKSMASYATGQVYTDVFEEAFVLPSTIPDCSGVDFDDCGNEQPSGSTVNIGTGRLSHWQDLFTLDNNRSLALGVTLHYRSVPFAPSSIGNGWSHSYEMTLQPGPGSSMVFWNRGTRQIFSKLNDAFVAPRGEYSKLVQNSDSSWSVTEPNGILYNLDSSGKVTSLVDRFSNYLTFGYTTGRLTSVTDSTGRSVTFGYHPTSGKLEKIFDPKLNAHILDYLDGNLDSVTPPGDKGTWRYSYANGLLETKTDPENNLTRYFYYPDNRLKQTTDPATKGRSHSYPSSTGSPGKVPDPYPVASLPQKQFVFREKDQNSWSYSYDTLIGKLRSVTDPYGKTTTYHYNADATLRAKTEPFGEGGSVTTFYTYDSRGNRLTETDPVDLSGYTPPIDPQKVDIASLARLTPPIKTAVSYGYDPDRFDDIESITDHRGGTPVTTGYERYTEPDGSGGTLLVTSITAPGETDGSTLTSYLRQNADGTVASITDAGSQTTSFTYYPINTTTIADGTSGMLLSITTPDKVKLACSAYDKKRQPVGVQADRERQQGDSGQEQKCQKSM